MLNIILYDLRFFIGITGFLADSTANEYKFCETVVKGYFNSDVQTKRMMLYYTLLSKLQSSALLRVASEKVSGLTPFIA